MRTYEGESFGRRFKDDGGGPFYECGGIQETYGFWGGGEGGKAPLEEKYFRIQ